MGGSGMITSPKIHHTICKILDALEKGTMSYDEIAEAIGQTKNNVRVRVNYLSSIYCVRLSVRPIPQDRVIHGGRKYEFVATLADRSKYKWAFDVEDLIEPDESIPYAIKSKTIPNCTLYKNLDRPARKEPLRKMNYGWMGYQSGLEA
jgi:predicted transcriptional regulator